MDHERIRLVGRIFSPSAPVSHQDLFIGRDREIRRIVGSLNEAGQHVVLYGARGAGKTSLANVMMAYVQNVICAKITCTRSDTFSSMWTKVLGKVRIAMRRKGVGFMESEEEVGVHLPELLPNPEDVQAVDIENIIEQIQHPMFFIFDEFDTITDEESQRKMADTLKLLSDNVSYATVMIVGISESVENLIGEHPSLERCLNQIDLTLMNKQELTSVITQGLAYTELEMHADLVQKVVDFSVGYPHYVHLLMKHAATEALYDESDNIGENHLQYAVRESVKGMNKSMQNAYRKAVASSRKQNQFMHVLNACALAPTDEQEAFEANDILKPFAQVTGKEVTAESVNYNLGMLCKEERGSILMKVGQSPKSRYRFTNPLMKAFVRLQMYHNKNE